MSNRRKTKKKNSRTKILLLLLIIFIAACLINRAFSPGIKDTRVVAYLPYWNYQCYENTDFKAVTHLCIAFVNPDSKGNMSCKIPDYELEKIISRAHRNGVQVLAALGGGNGFAHYKDLTSSKSSIKDFNDKIFSYIKSYDFDGIDLNIEGDVEPSFWNNYDMWVKDLQKRCYKDDLTLSCAVAIWFDMHIKEKTLDRFDFLSVMAYDNRGSRENHATYEYAKYCLDYFAETRNVKKDKLVLGIPFYGYRHDENGVCTGVVVTFGEIAAYNPDSEHADASGTCRYNGIDTVRKKTALGKEYGGVMVWALGQDATGRKSLLKAIKEAAR